MKSVARCTSAKDSSLPPLFLSPKNKEQEANPNPNLTRNFRTNGYKRRSVYGIISYAVSKKEEKARGETPAAAVTTTMMRWPRCDLCRCPAIPSRVAEEGVGIVHNAALCTIHRASYRALSEGHLARISPDELPLSRMWNKDNKQTKLYPCHYSPREAHDI